MIQSGKYYLWGIHSHILLLSAYYLGGCGRDYGMEKENLTHLLLPLRLIITYSAFLSQLFKLNSGKTIFLWLKQ